LLGEVTEAAPLGVRLLAAVLGFSDDDEFGISDKWQRPNRHVETIARQQLSRAQ
jgi:hypothetical protein